MLELKVIVCPIDFSEFSVRSYHHALSLAKHYRARLVALHIVELFRFSSFSFAVSAGLYDEACRAVHENGNERLQEFVKQYTNNEIQPDLVVHEGVAADSILAFVQAHKADLIVIGTHGQRGYDRLVLGSVTDRVMRSSSCPVLAVCKPPQNSIAANERDHVHHLRRILFCTDFSQNSEQALKYALSVRAEYDAELTLLHVLEHVPNSTEKEASMAATRAQLGKLISAEARKSSKIGTAVRIGKPYQQIIQLALETQADLVAMGVRGRGALDLAVFGSTTYRVIQLGPCPVLAVCV